MKLGKHVLSPHVGKEQQLILYWQRGKRDKNFYNTLETGRGWRMLRSCLRLDRRAVGQRHVALKDEQKEAAESGIYTSVEALLTFNPFVVEMTVISGSNNGLLISAVVC
jgi:hypothetical protein